MPDIPLQDYAAQVRELIRDRRYDEATAHCQHILRHYPKHLETYSLLGESCLEKGMHREATDFFQRTLSADPENLTARVGLGIIYDRQDALSEAIWQMERAFELAPGSDRVRDELQRLYTRRDGRPKERLYLTRGALGRLYARNALHERAIDEFNGLLDLEPNLPDIHVGLAESLWREGRRLEAVEACLNILQALPFCLKANLILVEILTRGGQVEAAKEKLGVVQALDPENLVALEVMGRDSPLPHEQVYVPLLEMAPDVLDITLARDMEEPDQGQADQVPEPVPGIESSGLPEAEPGWLQEIRSAVPDGPEVAAEQASLTAGGAPDEDAPDWLLEMAVAGAAVKAADREEPLEPEMETVGEEPSWLGDLPGAEDREPADLLVDEPFYVEPAESPVPGEGLPPLEESVILPQVSGMEPDPVPSLDEGLAAELAAAPPDEPADEPFPASEAPEAVPSEPEHDPPAPSPTGVQQPAPTGNVPSWASDLQALGAAEHRLPDAGDLPVETQFTVTAASAAAEMHPPPGPADDVPAWARSLDAAAEGDPAGDEPPPVALSRADELRAQLEEDPGDYQARLELARLFRAEEDWDAALALYDELASSGEVPSELIGDLNSLLDEDVGQDRVYQLLGDVYQQGGQADEALRMYRLAREA